MKLKFLALLLLFIANISFAQDNNSGIIYGENHAYSLTAPKGWVLDNESGVDQGIHAVFYPVGSSWANGTTVMYANFATYVKGQNNVDELISYDTSKFREQSPDLKIVLQKDIALKDGKIAKVLSFSNDKDDNTEAVAYIPGATGTVLIIITSRDKDEYEKYYPKFEELIKSYFWIADKFK
ncbi:MAG TPA: hypothetical protein VHP32_07175 [Ignavibacteria bacterium]|nr:hypothetical protein [Ignavibacteria bacterium]